MDISNDSTLAEVKGAFLKSNGHMILVDNHEFGLIVSGLRKMRVKLARDLRRSEDAGFEPEEGRIDLAKVKAKTLAALMDRLGISEKGERR